jgi:hypothetical protein
MHNSLRYIFFIFTISITGLLAAKDATDLKLTGGIELSAFPVHKASLLGLTSTEYPTFGAGFYGQYGRWSFYGITYLETMPEYVVLSQFETNIMYRVFETSKFRLSAFNTAISSSRNNAIFMIPTLSLAIGKNKTLKIDATPYTWGFNTNVAGFTYSLLYDKSFNLKRNNTFAGFQSKLVYTSINPLYKGFIEEFSPFWSKNNTRIQTRFIYQNAHNHFIFDIIIKQRFNL